MGIINPGTAFNMAAQMAVNSGMVLISKYKASLTGH